MDRCSRKPDSARFPRTGPESPRNRSEGEGDRPFPHQEPCEVEVIQTLIVCEKPDAAARVARALDMEGDPRRVETRGVPFYESHGRHDTILVCSALGHLYAVDSKTRASRRFYPVWDFEWKPKHIIDRKSARLAKWIHVISLLADKADRYINACDYDVEGSLIGYTILRYACHGSDSKAQRMKFSTMTEKELKTAYHTLAPTLDMPLVEAGRGRHELDWLYGINLSRLLTESALKQNRGYSTLSTGRVQGPTLKFVVDREAEIQCFTPTPFWTIDATIAQNGQNYLLEYEKEKISTVAEAEEIVGDCKGAILEVQGSESRKIQQSPPYPFDLANLQSEAYRHFGYTPSRTLAMAEKLYLEALISYPRTSSQKLPPDIGYSEILRGISNIAQYRSLASKLTVQSPLRPNQGPKEDSAHPAVYPTGESPRRTLIQPETNLFDLIVRRFMAAFAGASIRERSSLTLIKEPHRFFLRGSLLLREGWIEFYKPYASDESQRLPDLKVGDKMLLTTIRAMEKFTEPPPRYNPSSLLRKMEEENIGTKATRAGIIEILFRRGYIKNIRIEATPLALKVIGLLSKYCPQIIDPAFTAKLETSMDNIQTLQSTRTKVLAETLDYLRPIMLNLIARENEIGSQLAEVVTTQRIASVTFDHPCPQCGSKLKIIRSRVSGKRFIGCTGYEKGCRFTLPLPQFGVLSITKMHCKVCGLQLVQTRAKGRRPMISCARCYAKRTKATAAAAPPRSSSSQSADSLLEAAFLVED